MIAHHQRKLDRLVPPDFNHVLKHPFAIEQPILNVEKTLRLPDWHWSHDQGAEGSCVGHGVVMERSITNTGQNIISHILHPGRRYNPLYVWNEAKRLDPWPDTNPGDGNGTSVSAGYDVCRTIGLTRVSSMKLVGEVPVPINEQPVDLTAGVIENVWATTVDQIRTAISQGKPVAIGVNWYSNFDNPKLLKPNSEYFIGVGNLGNVRGGHCVCLYGASDKRQAFKLKNSWGHAYPLVWLTYDAMTRLLSEDGEAALVTDR